MTLSDVQHILAVRRQVMERHRDRIAAAEKERDDALAELARANRELARAMDRVDAEALAILRVDLGLEE